MKNRVVLVLSLTVLVGTALLWAIYASFSTKNIVIPKLHQPPPEPQTQPSEEAEPQAKAAATAPSARHGNNRLTAKETETEFAELEDWRKLIEALWYAVPHDDDRQRQMNELIEATAPWRARFLREIVAGHRSLPEVRDVAQPIPFLTSGLATVRLFWFDARRQIARGSSANQVIQAWINTIGVVRWLGTCDLAVGVNASYGMESSVLGEMKAWLDRRETPESVRRQTAAALGELGINDRSLRLCVEGEISLLIRSLETMTPEQLKDIFAKSGIEPQLLEQLDVSSLRVILTAYQDQVVAWMAKVDRQDAPMLDQPLPSSALLAHWTTQYRSLITKKWQTIAQYRLLQSEVSK